MPSADFAGFDVDDLAAGRLREGRGAPKDEKLALQLFQRAADHGEIDGAVQAAAMYRDLADRGDARAQTRLAWMFEAGRGVDRDLQEAARRFELAARAGEAEAQYALAVMYRTGKGRERDMAQSAAWMGQAAAQNHPAAVAAVASSEAAGVR